jgi:DNA-binding winged helix-turn-helix (wHTH) protein
VRQQFDDLAFDVDSRQLWVDGVEVAVSRKAFDLLALLIERRPHAVSKVEIRERLWPATFVSESSLPSLVSELRAVMRDRQRQGRLIRTVHGVGYAFGARESGVPERLASESTAATPHGWLLGASSEIALLTGDNVLGREGAGVIVLQSSTISRRHARVTIQGRVVVIQDLASKNGTFVNDRRVTGSTPLADGDQVRIGSLLFTFRLSQPAGSTETIQSTATLRP